VLTKPLNSIVFPRSELKPFFIHFVVLLALFLLLYGSLFPRLVRDWYEHQYASHGVLVLFISAYLLWDKRKLLRSLPIRFASVGSVLLFLGATIGVIGFTIDDDFTVRCAMLITLAGLVLFLVGRAYFKVLLFPLAYLFFMIPPPYAAIKEITYHLRMFDAKYATYILQASGIPVYRDAHLLHLPNITLEIADGCSGIASLFAMVALGIVYVYLVPLKKSSKLLLIGETIILPIVANLTRIVVVSASVYFYGPAMLQSFLHSFSGTFTFLLSVLLFLCLGEFFRRRDTEEISLSLIGTDEKSRLPEERNQLSSSYTLPNLSSSLFLVNTAVLMLAIYLSSFSDRTNRFGLGLNLQKVPEQLASFKASQENWPDRYGDPNASSSVSRVYERSKYEKIELFVGYRAEQWSTARLLSPRLHLPEGWEYVLIDAEELRVGRSGLIRANWLLTQKVDLKRLVLYWYEAKGDTFISEIWYRISLVKRLFLEGHTDGSVIRIATPVLQNETIDQAKNRIRELVGYLQPELTQLLPQ
jgi:EpsI family protein